MGNLPPYIMVVDDEHALVDMVASLIEDLGMRTMIATNGQEALTSLRQIQGAPALILSDVMMPKMNGIELTNAVKHDPLLKNVPVILMSAAGRPIGTSVADGFIHKPFDLDLLLDIIERYIVSNEREYGDKVTKCG
jgi:two-component system chemotaxis response regulator CheY